MIISVHQPQYLPWLGYFHKIYNSDAFVFLDNVQYKTREYQNRNRIRTANGWIWLTVPVIRPEHSYPNISSVRIDNARDWRRQHWKSLALNYGKAPFFKKYSDFFEDLYRKDWDALIDLNMYTVREIMRLLNIEKPVYLESQLDIKTTNTKRIIDICRALKGDIYLSGAGGKEYLDERSFTLSGIRLTYQDFKHPEYKQRHEPFVPFMSAVDLLFNHGGNALKILTQDGPKGGGL